VISILESKALVLELEAIVYKVIDNDEKKKRMRKRTPLFISKKGRESAFTYYTYSAGNKITLVKRG